MATSRRRERELARRRFERRRQAELERRARAKKRNTVIGATLGTLLVLGAVIGLVIGLSGGSKGKNAAKTRVNTIGPSSSTSPPSQNQPAPTKCAKIAPNPPANGQPTVPDVTGKAPTKLVVKDVKTGHGPAVKKGGSISVTYIGISCASGKVFDASYIHGGSPIPVSPLGHASVIPGWNQGLVGMKTGGVRELVVPAALAYGSAPPGEAPTFPNDTLIFLVTAKSVKA